MPRRPRVEFEGAIHHVTVRGVDRRSIFADDRDRLRFVHRLGDAVEECGVRLHLFCLMPNHVHLVVETPAANLSAFMQKLQTAYTIYFNLRHGRSGHLMQGRFHSRLVQGDQYLLKLSRYVHLNPVASGEIASAPLERRREALRQHRWSSYRGFAGLEESRPFVTETPTLALLAQGPDEPHSAYRRYVEDGLGEPDAAFDAVMATARAAVGDDAFRATAFERGATREGFRKKEHPAETERVLANVADSFGETVAGLCRRRRGCVARAVAARMLVRHARLTRKAVAPVLGMGSGAAVSDQLGRLGERLRYDEPLAAKVAVLSQQFDADTSA